MRDKETLLLIALVGGSRNEREAFSQSLIGSGKARLVEFAQPHPDAAYPYRRLNILHAALDDKAIRRRGAGVVVTHCLTEQEAALVRELGGVVWHLYKRPSSLVVIRSGDAIVTNDEHGWAHVRSPLEALSELMLE